MIRGSITRENGSRLKHLTLTLRSGLGGSERQFGYLWADNLRKIRWSLTLLILTLISKSSIMQLWFWMMRCPRRDLAVRDQRHNRYAFSARSVGMQALTAIKRGLSPRSPVPTIIKAEGTPLPIVKTEAPSPPTDSRNQGRTEPNPSCRQSITSCDGMDSDTASEADGEYSHAKVCDGFQRDPVPNQLPLRC